MKNFSSKSEVSLFSSGNMKKLIISTCLLFFFSCTTVVSLDYRPEDCNESCGSFGRIPYPFGIQDGCFLNRKFQLSCNTSNNPSQLMWGGLQVENISILDADMYVLVSYARRCYLQSGRLKTISSHDARMNTIPNFPFSYTKNRFTVVGCDTYAWIRDGDRRTGCMSLCPTNQRMIEDRDGMGYCHTSIPRGSYNLIITSGSFYNHTDVWNFNPCDYSFLAAVDFYNFTPSDLTSYDLRNAIGNNVPVVVDWSIGDQSCEQAQMNSTSFICGKYSNCSNTDNGSGYNCYCSPGYEGNPYLPNGCQDINECLVNSNNNCAENSRCQNTPGNYTCSCKHGFEGDGMKNGTQCRPINSPKNLTLYISLGIGSVLVVIIACTIIFWIWRKRKHTKLKEKFFERNGGFLLQQLLEQKEISSNMLKIFTAEELELATNNYDSSLIAGKGGYGTVYKGTLPDESLVAIKKSNQTDASIDEEQVKQFISEIAILCQVNNRNIVHLRGCCFETPTPILVYEFVSNGTLSEHLHKGKSSAVGILSMGTRLRIASQTARVLSYLHSEAVMPIIHRDIKSTNILLDEDFNAKVSDFGASRLVASDEMQVCTMVQGTLGYLDPEYMQTGELTDKSDVYSFGVMLVELITGQKAVSFDKPEAERNLAKYFLCALKENRLTQVLDQLVVEEGTFEFLRKVADIAKRCLSMFGEERPSMKQVAMELEGIIDFGLERYSSPWIGQKIHSEKENVHLLDESEEYSSRTVSTSYDTIRNQVLITFPAEGR